MSDFAFQYFNSELDKLALPELTQILEKVKTLISKKSGENASYFHRELDGLEAGFFMTPDFDETPDCFGEYL